MGASDPIVAGWYPDADTGGKKYWDGSRWTGDVRPRRRRFAASSEHRGWGIGLMITGVLFVVTSPEQLGPAEANTASTTSPISYFFFQMAIGLMLAALGVYLFRGQGPTTKAIEARVAAASTSARMKRITRPPQQPVVVNVGGSTADDAATVAQINALTRPETAKAIQNLQNLLYTHAITDAEFQAAKDKLLGDGRRERAGIPPGWYDDRSGSQRWWDGQQWTHHVQDEYADGVSPVASFPCEIDGQSAQVHFYSDRVEWFSRGGVSAGKITTGLLTGGASLIFTGVGKGSYGAGGTAGSETILLTSITRVASARSGSRTTVSITTPGGVLPLRLGHLEATRATQTLNALISNAARETAQASAPVVVQVTAPATTSAPVPATAPAEPDPVAQIAKLAELQLAGVLSAAEFATAKAKLLGL